MALKLKNYIFIYNSKPICNMLSSASLIVFHKPVVGTTYSAAAAVLKKRIVT
jgi:hypothetical protein